MLRPNKYRIAVVYSVADFDSLRNQCDRTYWVGFYRPASSSSSARRSALAARTGETSSLSGRNWRERKIFSDDRHRAKALAMPLPAGRWQHKKKAAANRANREDDEREIEKRRLKENNWTINDQFICIYWKMHTIELDRRQRYRFTRPPSTILMIIKW